MSVKIWERYPKLTRAVKGTHDVACKAFNVAMFHCHDFDHVVRVADRAMNIAENENVGRLAAVAALCHNADRIIQVQDRLGPFGKASDDAVMIMVNRWLNTEPEASFGSVEHSLIIDAVLHHSERNSPDDSPVLVTLKDADRTINIEADVIMRKAQYFGNSLRVVDPVNLLDDPEAKFTRPGSLVKALQFDIADFEKEGGVASLRLRKAREIAKPRFDFLRLYLETVISQRENSGLVPYPKFD